MPDEELIIIEKSLHTALKEVINEFAAYGCFVEHVYVDWGDHSTMNKPIFKINSIKVSTRTGQII